MLFYPDLSWMPGVCISAHINANISFNLVVLLYLLKNVDVCRLVHTMLGFTISEYHSPTNSMADVCSCDPSSILLNFSNNYTQIRNPWPHTIICNFQIWQHHFPHTRMLLKKPDNWPMPTLIWNITKLDTGLIEKYPGGHNTSQHSTTHVKNLKLWTHKVQWVTKGVTMFQGQIHWKVWKSWQVFRFW